MEDVRDCIQIPKQVAVEVHGNRTAPLVLLMIKKRIVVMKFLPLEERFV
jgi:hypothetical protein